MNLFNLSSINPYILIFLVIWEIIWKGIAMWYAARNKQKVWFIVILLVNSLGTLPIIYYFFFRKKSQKLDLKTNK